MALLLLCTSTIYDQRNPMQGRVVRFRTPVAINPHGNASILKAIANYTTRSNGLVTFQIVDTDPATGITVISGDAVDRYGKPGCGNVTSQPDASSGHRFAPDSTGALAQRAYLHLGSSGCDDTRTGWTSSSVAEHELAHALGVGSHFDGFTGDEGLSEELFAVIMLLYGAAPGTDMSAFCPPH
jgi:predicted Zn-dependent protease